MKPVKAIIDYQLLRSHKRKTVAIQIKSSQVFVRAPMRTSVAFIQQFVDRKLGWIQRKLTEQKQLLSFEPLAFFSGRQLLYLGEPLSLALTSGTRYDIELAGSVLTLQLPERLAHEVSLSSGQARIYERLTCWYKERAEKFLPERVAYYSEQTGLCANKLSIKRFKARWGSCDQKGHIKLNYLLMSAPIWVIDYVIIHELCHLQHLNHSPAFWQLVNSHFPHFKQAKNWLRQHQQQLLLR